MLGQVPIEQKEQIFTAQHNVSVAEANKVAAERARDENQAFVALADDELAAAKARMEAAKSGMELGARTRDAPTLRTAERQHDVAMRQLAAARSKKDYADKLAQLRDGEVALTEREVELANQDLAMARASALRRHGLNPAERFETVLARRSSARAAVADEQRRLARLRDEVDSTKVAWQQRAQVYNVAARDLASDGATIHAPAGARTIRPEPLRVHVPEPVAPLPVDDGYRNR